MVHVSTETPYMKLFESFLAKKHRLAADAWGADDSAVRHIYQPLYDHIVEEIPEQFRNAYPYPVWTLSSRVNRITKNILLSEYLVREWADHFKGKTEAEIEEIAASFRFENCMKRERLNEYLSADARTEGSVHA